MSICFFLYFGFGDRLTPCNLDTEWVLTDNITQCLHMILLMHYIYISELGDGWAPVIMDTAEEYNFIRKSDIQFTDTWEYYLGGTTNVQWVDVYDYYIPNDSGVQISHTNK